MAFSGGINRADARFVVEKIGKTTVAAVDRAMVQAGLEIEGRMLDRFNAGGLSVKNAGQFRRPAGDFLFSRTGALKDSFSHAIAKGRSALDRTLQNRSSGTPYARTQEFGAVIRPVRAKWLTVPLPDNLTAAGDTRWPSARVLFDEEPSKTWIHRAPSGRSFILYQEHEDAKPLWLFILLKQVKIPPRLGFRRTVQEYAPRFVEVLAKEIRAELERRKAQKRGRG